MNITFKWYVGKVCIDFICNGQHSVCFSKLNPEINIEEIWVLNEMLKNFALNLFVIYNT